MSYRIPIATALCAALAVLTAAVPATATPTSQRPVQALPGPDLGFRGDPAVARNAHPKPISRGKLRRKLQRLARKGPGSSGYYVAAIGGKAKHPIFDRNGGHSRKLASNEKLFTTTTALHRLGSKSRIATRVKVRGGVNRRGKLSGDVYLVGGGDPSFGSAGIADLAKGVRKSGIKRVSGTVIGDDSVFDRRRGVPDSNWGPSPYVAPLSGLVYGGSTYEEDPAKEAARAFRDALRADGVKVGGKVEVKSLPDQLRKEDAVGSWESGTIAQLAAATNKPSNNFYAEMLLKRLDASDSHQGTTKGGTGDVERYVASLGSKVDARDGSGLTRHNRSSPEDVVALLAAARSEDDLRGPLFDSLSIAGQDGTLADRMGGTVAAGRCRGKTGTITGVSNLSGYCKSGSGLVAFSLLMNGVGDLTSAHNIQDEMAVQIARYRP